jgi:serine/threonine-protein kinase
MSPVPRLLHEAEVLSRLSHPNIVALYECSQDKNGHPFLVLEPLDGQDLRSLLDENSLLPSEQVLAIVRAVGAALQHAHAVGIVHVDLNPCHIFLQRGPRSALGAERIKVMNFGLAKQMIRAGASQELQLHQIRLTAPPTYLAPEALELGSGLVDPRADQWSLAVLAYQLLSGRLPFWDSDAGRLRELISGAAEPVPLQHHLPDLPAYLFAAIHKALSKKPDQRYATMADFMRALDGPSAWTPDSIGAKPSIDLSDQIEECPHEPGQSAASPSAPVGEAAAQKDPAHAFPSDPPALPDDVPAGGREPQSPSLQAAVAPSILLLPHRPGAIRRFWLAGCFGLSMASVSMVAAREYLHASPPISPVPTRPSQPMASARALVMPPPPPTPLVPALAPRTGPPAAVLVSPPTPVHVEPPTPALVEPPIPAPELPPSIRPPSRPSHSSHHRQRMESRQLD